MAEYTAKVYGGLPVQTVASVVLPLETLSVLEVSLRLGDEELGAIWERFYAANGVHVEGGHVIYGCPGLERKTGRDCLLAYIAIEENRSFVPTVA